MVSMISDWETRYEKSVVHQYDIEISEFTRWIAQSIDDIDLQHIAINKKLFSLVYDLQFERYNFVFDQFNFNFTMRALLLSQVYPIEKFESMAAFKKRIGAAKDDNSSGDLNMHIKGGSKLCLKLVGTATLVSNSLIKARSGESLVS